MPVTSTKMLAYIARWKKEHPENVKAHRKAYREKHLGYLKVWRKNNPDKVKIYNETRRAKARAKKERSLS